METRVVRACGDPGADREVMKEAAGIIKAGGLVAIPTETVYGLAGDALNPSSSKKIYEAKGRPSDNPLIVHIAKLKDMERIAEDIPGTAYKLAEKYWPGPLTMILKKKEIVPYETTGGLDTVAVRFPVNMIAREFIEASGGFIAAPSANRSGRPSCTTAKHCLEDLDGKVDMIIDGGEVGIGLESTIIDLTGGRPCILRQGYINEEMLRDALGDVETEAPETEHPKAPGMKYRHYAPKGIMKIVQGEGSHVEEKIIEMVSEHLSREEKVAVISSHEKYQEYLDNFRDRSSVSVYDIGSTEDEDLIAHRLFAILREIDDTGAGYIYSESFDTPRLGKAIMDRLYRAAGHNIIYSD
ncbi:MAG: threonylcarbamoyl-AMP synthase [Lachnospiraceae bacterium]|nr:threonylcarbamoyl-AMP synthase [Lachnospiraceae bacterium]